MRADLAALDAVLAYLNLTEESTMKPSLATPSTARSRSLAPAWLVGAIAGACLLGAPPAGAKPAYRATCRSGKTLFRHNSVRAFRVSFFDATDRGKHQELLACRRGSRRPMTLYDPGPFNFLQAERFSLLGTRLGFVLHVQGVSNGSQTDVGWADLHSGRVALGWTNTGENHGPGDPLLPEDDIGYAIAPDGAVAMIAGTSCQVVALLPLRAKADAAGNLLGPPLVVFTAPHGGLNPNSVAVTDAAVSWRIAEGMPTSVARPPRPPDGTVTANPTGGC